MLCIDKILVDHRMIQTNSGAEIVFEPWCEAPQPSRKNSQGNLDKSRQCLVGEWLSVQVQKQS